MGHSYCMGQSWEFSCSHLYQWPRKDNIFDYSLQLATQGGEQLTSSRSGLPSRGTQLEGWADRNTVWSSPRTLCKALHLGRKKKNPCKKKKTCSGNSLAREQFGEKNLSSRWSGHCNQPSHMIWEEAKGTGLVQPAESLQEDLTAAFQRRGYWEYGARSFILVILLHDGRTQVEILVEKRSLDRI